VTSIGLARRDGFRAVSGQSEPIWYNLLAAGQKSPHTRPFGNASGSPVCGHARSLSECWDMKNVQIIDGGNNATFSLFQVTDEEFAAIFPDGCDMELIEDLIERLGEDTTSRLLKPIWGRPILKREAHGLHGTLYYDNEHRRIPTSKREVDWDDRSINPAQRELFSRHRE